MFSDSSPDEIAAEVRNMDWFGGSSWPRRAFTEAYEDIWSDNLDTGRDKVTMLISDGLSIQMMRPCGEFVSYQDQGIEIYEFITNGDESCPEVSNVTVATFLNYDDTAPGITLGIETMMREKNRTNCEL